MSSISVYASFLLFTLIFNSCSCVVHHHEVAADDETRREALEIIIGGGGGGNSPAPSPDQPECNYCPTPPPPEPECPPPPPPEPECPPPPPPPSPPPPPPPSPPPPPPPSPPPPPPPSPSPPPPPSPSPPPPPSPKPHPNPPPPVNQRLKLAYNVIRKFAPRITYDPNKIVKTWKGKNVCKYKGFVCDKHPFYKVKAVAGVDFNNFSFGGPKFNLNMFLDSLVDLAIFHANSNNFSLTIPNFGRKLEYFYELDVSNNKLSDKFPVQVLDAKNISFLDLRFNSFYGAIPPGLFNLKLDALFINNNKFDQQLPQNLGSTTALYITFANNRFTGRIPRSIGSAKYLLEVLFLNNTFSGCLPYEIGLLSNATIFDASTNLLTGPIPLSFACLASMQILNLANNQFYGPVPEMVCKLPKLTNLSLSYNYFTEVGPECRKLIAKKRLDVRMNCILDLPYQRSAEECKKFFSMPRNCPDQKSMTYLPCKKNGYLSNATQTSDQISTVAAPPPVTYDALKPHKL